MCPLPRRSVDVHSGHAGGGETVAQETLDLLCAQPAASQRIAIAASAARGRLLLVQAVVADQPLGCAMVRERDAAVRARRDRSTLIALHECRVPSAIQQQDALLAAREPVRERFLEGMADDEPERIRWRVRLS